MINLDLQEGGLEDPVAMFPSPISGNPIRKYIPVSNHILLHYEKPTKAGLIQLPGQMKPLDTIVCPVLAVGPDCEQIKAGQRVLILTRALVGGPDGLLVEGQRIFITQEHVIISIVE